MGFSFRKSIKVGPFRTTLSHRGLTNSVGAGGLRYSKTAKFANMGSSKRHLRGGEGEPSTERKGNPVVGFIVLAVIAFALYKLLT